MLRKVYAVVLVGFIILLAISGALLWYYRDEFGGGGAWRALFVSLGAAWASLASIAASYYLTQRRVYEDQVERWRMSDWQLLERGLANDFKHMTARQADKLVSREVIAETIDARIDEALVSGVDRALRKRVSQEAKVVDVIGYIDAAEQRIRTVLDGPAARAETRSGWLMILAIAIGAFGLFIAYLRVRGLGDLPEGLQRIKSIAGENSVWPYIIALSAPWVTLIALVEFTALMLLKLSNKLSLEQRHYTELLVEFTERMLALKAVARFGNSDQVVTAASLLVKNNPKAEAKNVEMEESLSAITKITESLAGIVKQFASKESKPGG